MIRLWNMARWKGYNLPHVNVIIFYEAGSLDDVNYVAFIRIDKL